MRTFRFDPFSTFPVFDQLAVTLQANAPRATSWTAEDTAYTLRLPAVGVSPADIDLQVAEQRLSLALPGRQHVWRLPDDAVADTVSASVARGLLTVTVPRQAPPSPRRVVVQESVPEETVPAS